jgi:hypothetical protein
VIYDLVLIVTEMLVFQLLAMIGIAVSIWRAVGCTYFQHTIHLPYELPDLYHQRLRTRRLFQYLARLIGQHAHYMPLAVGACDRRIT